MGYDAWGNVRYVTGTLPTDIGYTGQRGNLDIGLLFYNARFYSAVLGRFISADTIVPDSSNPQSLNRLSYTRNNPLKYIDPSGHKEMDCQYGEVDGHCVSAPSSTSNTGSASNGGTNAGEANTNAIEVLTAIAWFTTFDTLTPDNILAFDYPYDGCWARAHIMAQRMAAAGITSRKVWAFASPGEALLATTSVGTVQWNYHVALSVSVRGLDGKIRDMVIDPALSRGPVGVDTWAHQMKNTGKNSNPTVLQTNLGEALPSPYGPPNNTGYWPGDDPTSDLDNFSASWMRQYHDLAHPIQLSATTYY